MKQQKGYRLLYSCLNMRRELNKLISSGNLSLGEYLVLRKIWFSNSDLSGHSKKISIKAADLSVMLKLPRPSITRILNSLERRGLITRNIDEKDRRSFNIEMTAEGIKTIEKANSRILNVAERIVELLRDSDTDKLIELIDRLTEIYREMAEENEGRKDE